MVERKIIVTCEKLNSFNHYKTSYCPTTYLLTKTKSLLFMRQNIIKYANSVHIFNNNNKKCILRLRNFDFCIYFIVCCGCLM